MEMLLIVVIVALAAAALHYAKLIKEELIKDGILRRLRKQLEALGCTVGPLEFKESRLLSGTISQGMRAKCFVIVVTGRHSDQSIEGLARALVDGAGFKVTEAASPSQVQA